MSQHEPESGLSFERIVFFSDAVFAIAITLLVLEIKPPHLEVHSESAMRNGLLHLVPKFSGFIVSFLIIGLMWIEHHRIYRYITDYDMGLLWRNLIFLLTVSFVPFPTALFSEYYWSQTAFILYTASFAAVGLTKLWVWQYVVRRGTLLGLHTDPLTAKRISRRSLALPLACALAILLSAVSVWIAPMAFGLIPLLAWLLDPTRRNEQKDEASTAAGA